MDQQRKEALKKVLDVFGIVPNDYELYNQAFTHASYRNEHPDSMDYDRLEFLGDSILDMVVADLLYHYYPDSNSGRLSKI